MTFPRVYSIRVWIVNCKCTFRYFLSVFLPFDALLFWEREQTEKRICAVYGGGAIAESTIRKWFTKFERNFYLKYRELCDRTAVINDDKSKRRLKIIHVPRHETLQRYSIYII